VSTSYVFFLGSEYLTNALPEGDQVLNSALVKDYEDIFISVNRFGTFESSDFDLSRISEYDDETPVPDYVAESERELRRKPGLATDVCYFLDYSFHADRHRKHYAFKAISDDRFLDTYFHRGSTEGELPRRNAGEDEVVHLAYIARRNWESCWNGIELKEQIMKTIFFQYFAVDGDRGDIKILMYALTFSPPFVTTYRLQG